MQTRQKMHLCLGNFVLLWYPLRANTHHVVPILVAHLFIPLVALLPKRYGSSEILQATEEGKEFKYSPDSGNLIGRNGCMNRHARMTYFYILKRWKAPHWASWVFWDPKLTFLMELALYIIHRLKTQKKIKSTLKRNFASIQL